MKRFHDNFGNFVGLSRMLMGATSFCQALQRRMFDRYPELPWIPFRAISALSTLCRNDWKVVEIGGGMSTLWLSERCGHIITIEASEAWYRKLSELLSKRKLTNVDLRYEPCGDKMCDFSAVDDGAVDLLFIDGGPRQSCLAHGFSKVRSSGWIYLDNWDVPAFWVGSNEFLVARSNEIASSTRFTDYVPGSWCVNSGLLLQKR